MMGASRSGLKVRSWGVSAAALLGLSFGLAAAIGPAEADKVGVAAAVNPDAFSSLAGSPQSQLNIGKSIFYNERINTTTSGLVQVLLVDGSTFTVGPGSDLVIDKFVYDPKKGVGQISASFSKGVMRFVGGKISKNEGGVTVNTPAGALAIRGGMVQGSVKGPNVIFSFLYGQQMTLGKYTVFQPGYTIDTSTGAPTIRPTTPADIAAVMASLTNGNTGGINSNSSDGSNPNKVTQLLSTQSLNQLISDANATQIQNEIDEQLNQPSNQQQTVALGYAAGIYGQISDNEDDDPVGTLNTLSPTDFALLFDASGTFAGASSTLFVNGGEPGMGGAKIVYSPISLPPDLAEELPDDLAEILFVGAASSEADPNAFKVYENTIEGENGPELDDLAQLNFGEALLVGVSGAGEAFCETCDFIKWGAWLTILDFQTNPEGSPDQVNVAGWWIAGDLPTIGQLPVQGTATYTGVTYGKVAALIQEGCASFWDTYTASGTVNMEWDFNQRTGILDISNFDADGQYGPLNVSGRMDMPGQLSAINKFSGPLLGTLESAPYSYSNSIDGGAVGSFAANGADKTAGVVGNWGVGNDYYKASGIFGAGRVR